MAMINKKIIAQLNLRLEFEKILDSEFSCQGGFGGKAEQVKYKKRINEFFLF